VAEVPAEENLFDHSLGVPECRFVVEGFFSKLARP
jgi:hypothetical protein